MNEPNTLEEAVNNAGTRILSLPGDAPALRVQMPTVEELKKLEAQEDLAGISYEGPYRVIDPRNLRTWKQDTGDTIPQNVLDALEEVPDVPPVTIAPQNASYGTAGGSGSFTVAMTGPGMSRSWTVDQDSETLSWLHVTSPELHTPQTADGSVMYTADPNASGAPRTARMYVNGKTFSVDQSEV